MSKHTQDRAAEAATVRHSISLNAAIFAAVCLGSRLPSSVDVFVLVACAMQLFVLLPEFRYHVQFAMSATAFDVLTAVHWIAALALLWSIDAVSLAVAAVLVLCATTFVIPLVFMSRQQYKNEVCVRVWYELDFGLWLNMDVVYHARAHDAVVLLCLTMPISSTVC